MEKIIFASEEEVNKKSLLASKKKSGIPFIYKDKKILNNDYHTLVIGEDESQKEEKIISPLIEQISNTGESFIINEKSGKQYKKYATLLKDKGYKVFCLNMDNLNDSDGLNILQLAYNLYNEKNLDKSIEIVENIGFYLFYDKSDINSDPYWINSTISFFVGCVLYMFETSKEISMGKLIEISENIKIEDVLKNGVIYNYLSGILMAPQETKLSILSVYNQRINRYISKTNLNNILSNSTFDIKDIVNGKVAIFIIEGVSEISTNITPLIIHQIYYICNLYNSNNKINVIIDDFDELCPIKNVGRIISLFTNLNVTVTAFVKNYVNLSNVYGKESGEILKLSFKNLIYLYSSNIPTLEEIAKLCDISDISYLRQLSEDEAIFIIVRMRPFKVNL